jgi:hypothetical protein
MLIPLDRVFENGHNVRRVKASKEADEQLRQSIAAIGIPVAQAAVHEGM